MTLYFGICSRKKRSLVRLAGIVVAMVTLVSVAMVSQLQHVADVHEMSMDYNFDSKNGFQDYNPLDNDIDHLSNDVVKLGNNGKLLNLQRRDTLGLKNDYRYAIKKRNIVDEHADKNENIVFSIDETPVRKVNDNGDFIIERNEELVNKERDLRILRAQRLENVPSIVDNELDSDYDYHYGNDNSVFKPGDFDIPEHFYDTKVKFIGRKNNENDDEIGDNDSNYDDDYDDDDDDDELEENDGEVDVVDKGNKNTTNNHPVAAMKNKSFLLQNSELDVNNIVSNLLHSMRGGSQDNLIRDPCGASLNCSVNNEVPGVRSNTNMHGNDHANLPAFHVSKQYPNQNNTQTLDNVKRQKMVQQNVSNDNLEYQNNIETQIPVQDEFHAVAMEFPQTQMHPHELLGQHVDLHNTHGMPIVVDKIYWSTNALQLVPKGISEEEFQDFLNRVANQPITVMHEPKWNQCGRLKNQYVELADGTAMCARYRLPHIDLVQGEILSFYLSRFLGMDNVPPVVISKVDTNTTQWRKVESNIQRANWQNNSLVALILWINNIESREYMPSVILEAYENNSTLSLKNPKLSVMTSLELSDVIQWSDLILFDYLTGNYDRVASMQDGAEKEHKSSIMHESIRNLRKDKANSRLWFIDNESGLLDAYELMYHVYRHEASRFLRFHKQILQTICIFNPNIARKIRQMAQHAAPHELLVKYATQQEVLYTEFPWTKSLDLFRKNFHTRLKEITKWFDKCESIL